MRFMWLLISCAIGVAANIEHDFRGFDDSILFAINWPGSPEENFVDVAAEALGITPETSNYSKKEVMRVKTANNEKYECIIPELKTKESTNIEDYSGPSPLSLLKPLFHQNICSYRLETYWSYEVCHGRYVRQYHEEREGKQVKTQQYYLGHWSRERQIKLESEAEAAEEAKAPLKTTKVEGMTLPFVEMTMDEGTVCDLSGKPRLTRVLYVCYNHGKHEIYSFKETATCEYEIIILSPYLCEHPQYKPNEVSENNIECLPIDGAPKKPRSLLQMEVDNMNFQRQTIKMMNNIEKQSKDILAVLKLEKTGKEGGTHLKLELHQLDDDTGIVKRPKNEKPGLIESRPIITDDSPVRAFLNGEDCLNGGTGWWKYEFCYGRHVAQYHVDRTGEKTTLVLGKFDEEKHLEWIRDNKGKAPKPVESRTSISHFYAYGDICDKTGKPRQTEVKLKCLENSSSPAQVSLYLLEPRTCHYILGVESPLICKILHLADENGLIKQDGPLFLKPEQDQTPSKEAQNSQKKMPPKFGND